MFKKFLTFIMLIFIIIGAVVGVYFAAFSNNDEETKVNALDSVFDKARYKTI